MSQYEKFASAKFNARKRKSLHNLKIKIHAKSCAKTCNANDVTTDFVKLLRFFEDVLATCSSNAEIVHLLSRAPIYSSERRLNSSSVFEIQFATNFSRRLPIMFSMVIGLYDSGVSCLNFCNFLRIIVVDSLNLFG